MGRKATQKHPFFTKKYVISIVGYPQALADRQISKLANQTMSESKKILPRLEMLIIAVFFIGFLFWTMSRCNSTRAQYSNETIEDQRADSTMQAMNRNAILEKARKDSIAMAVKAAKAEEAKIVRERVTPLYTTVDKVNVRREPKLDAAVVSKLVLNEEVTFLNEVTDFKQEITIEGVVYNEPWVKVKTQAGRVGWVYGGTISYYKSR